MFRSKITKIIEIIEYDIIDDKKRNLNVIFTISL